MYELVSLDEMTRWEFTVIHFVIEMLVLVSVKSG